MRLKILNEESTIDPELNFLHKNVETLVNTIPEYIFDNYDYDSNSINRIVWLFFNDHNNWIYNAVYIKCDNLDDSIESIELSDIQEYPNYKRFKNKNIESSKYDLISKCESNLMDIHKKSPNNGLIRVTITIDLKTNQFRYEIDYNSNDFIDNDNSFKEWANKYLT